MAAAVVIPVVVVATETAVAGTAVAAGTAAVAGTTAAVLATETMTAGAVAAGIFEAGVIAAEATEAAAIATYAATAVMAGGAALAKGAVLIGEHLVDALVGTRCASQTAENTDVLEEPQTSTESRKKKKTCSCKSVTLKVFYVNIQSLNPAQRNQEKLYNLRKHIESTEPDIVALVETWLKADTSIIEYLNDIQELNDYTIYQYNRDESLDSDEKDRNGGGLMLAVHNRVVTDKGFTVERTDWKGNTFSQFFTFSRDFSCGVCTRTGVAGPRKGTKTYNFVLHYKRPAAFRRNRTTAENPGNYRNKVDQAFEQLATNFSRYLDPTLSGGVIVGDFNLIEHKNEWEEYVGKLRTNERDWNRVSLWPDESTTDRNTPDGMIAFPPGFVKHLKVTELGTVHKGINFELYFGRDFEQKCEKCHD